MKRQIFPDLISNKPIVGAVVGCVVLVVAALGLVILKPGQPAITSIKEAGLVTVAITESGFKPAVLTIKPGTKVKWINYTSSPHRVGSNPFPERTDLPELYSDEPIAPGASYEFVFRSAGHWGFNDSTKPTAGGTVVVKD